VVDHLVPFEGLEASGFEEVVRVFVETRETFVLPLGLNILLIVIAVATPVFVFFWSDKRSKR